MSAWIRNCSMSVSVRICNVPLRFLKFGLHVRKLLSFGSRYPEIFGANFSRSVPLRNVCLISISLALQHSILRTTENSAALSTPSRSAHSTLRTQTCSAQSTLRTQTCSAHSTLRTQTCSAHSTLRTQTCSAHSTLRTPSCSETRNTRYFKCITLSLK